MPNRIIPFYVPWITREDKKAVSEALNSRWLTGGPKVARFEEAFAKYVGIRYAVAVSSCTAALHLAMRVLNIGPGDEVIVPSFTFAATANAPLFCRAKPVFADIDEKTFNISPNDILEKITTKTKAIIPVHYGGQPCDMKEILEIAEDHRLFIVEDCAHSLGAAYKGKKTGSFGVMGCFSFYPTKIITTLEGGMVTTNDEKLAAKLRILREHGMSKTALAREISATWYYDVEDLGYNYRLNEVQAALGISQLKRISKGIRRRIRLAHYYTKKLNNMTRGIITPNQASDRTHIFHLYVIRVKENIAGINRDTLFSKLRENGIETSVHYTPLHLMSFYRKMLKTRLGTLPVTERVYKEVLSLPLYPTMTRKDVDFITETIRNCVK
ncbi:MAG: DegT/DnrJ/EryC1/StrS family aminotransferase [Candidatus Bathyarchaeia archaeon]